MTAGGDVEIVGEMLAEVHGVMAGALERLVDPPELIGQGLAEVAENDVQARVLLEDAAEDEAHGLGRGLHRIAPGGAHHLREVLAILVIIDARHIGVRERRVEIDRHAQSFRPLIDAPEALIVVEHAIGQAADHGADETQILHAALELAGGGFRIGGGQGGEARKTGGMAGDGLGQTIIDAPCQIHADRGVELLRRGGPMGEDLNIDAGLVHFPQAQFPQIIEALELLGRPRAFRTLELGGELMIPKMFFQRDDRHFLVHDGPTSCGASRARCALIAAWGGLHSRVGAPLD